MAIAMAKTPMTKAAFVLASIFFFCFFLRQKEKKLDKKSPRKKTCHKKMSLQEEKKMTPSLSAESTLKRARSETESEVDTNQRYRVSLQNLTELQGNLTGLELTATQRDIVHKRLSQLIDLVEEQSSEEEDESFTDGSVYEGDSESESEPENPLAENPSHSVTDEKESKEEGKR